MIFARKIFFPNFGRAVPLAPPPSPTPMTLTYLNSCFVLCCYLCVIRNVGITPIFTDLRKTLG